MFEHLLWPFEDMDRPNSSRIYPAEEVYVTGEFDNWERTVKLERNGDIFSKDVIFGEVDQDMPYKFFVDGEWMFDPAQPQITDDQHNINNILHFDRMTKTKILVESALDETADPTPPESTIAEFPTADEEDEEDSPFPGIPPSFWKVTTALWMLLALYMFAILLLVLEEQEKEASVEIMEVPGEQDGNWLLDVAVVVVRFVACSSDGSGSGRIIARQFDIDCSR